MCGLPDGSARLWSCIPDLISKAPRELCAWGRTHGPVATDSARGDGPIRPAGRPWATPRCPPKRTNPTIVPTGFVHARR